MTPTPVNPQVTQAPTSAVSAPPVMNPAIANIISTYKSSNPGTYTPTAQDAGSSNWYDAVKAGTYSEAPTPTKPSPSIAKGVEDTASNYESDVTPAAQDVTGGGNLGAAVSSFEKGGAGNDVKGAEDATLGLGSDAVSAIFAPLSAPLQTLIKHGSTTPSPTDNVVNSPEAKAAQTSLKAWAAQHPNIAKTLTDALNVGGGLIGGEGLDADVGETINSAKEGVSNTVKNTAQGAKGTLDTATEAVSNVGKPKPTTAGAKLDASIDAVNPDLSGKKLVSAYKGTVTGKQGVTPASIFREQGLTPSEQTTNLGTRLADLGLGKNPVKNLTSLGQAMTDTEAKLGTALDAHPEVDLNKEGLLSKLESARTQMPREFSAIRDSKAVFNNVINFAKETVSKAGNTLRDGREARTAFDTQAKAEYPNAFKNGVVDTSTPAGRAIQVARDTMNGHLYDTAPNGSELQNLVGREADLYRATDAVAPKAAAGNGKNFIQQAIKAHPVLAKYLGYTAGALGVDKIVKGVTGVGF